MSKQGHSQEQIDRKLVSIGRLIRKRTGKHYQMATAKNEYNDKIRTTFLVLIQLKDCKGKSILHKKI